MLSFLFSHFTDKEITQRNEKVFALTLPLPPWLQTSRPRVRRGGREVWGPTLDRKGVLQPEKARFWTYWGLRAVP